MSFIDREQELKFLTSEYSRKGSSLVILYGRRRNGKTTLIKEFMKDKKGLYFLSSEEDEMNNLENFKNRIYETYEIDVKPEIKSFDDAFKFLIKIDKKPLIIIDEFQYLTMSNQAFASIFQRIWDLYLEKTNSKIILCGSYIRMMEEQTLNYSSPLYGRRTGQIKLKQIRFQDYNKFYKSFDKKKLVEYYAVTGGVPKYIELFNKEKDIFKAIEKNILNKNSFLYEEPEFLLKNEVKDVGTYFSIIKVIATGASKLSEIAEKLNVKQTGLTNYLKTLIEIEIIRREVPITDTNPEKSKKSIYKINDNFIRFWFRFIYPHRDQIEMGNTEYVLNIIKRNFIDNHVSYVYEDICREMMLTDKKIHVDKVGKWWDKNDEIDVVGIDNKHKVLYLGECKYTKKKMNVSILNELKRKSEKIVEFKDYKKVYCLFSINGFDTDLLKAEKNDKNVILSSS
ncbi:MAG: ATP-binding protein [Lachnospiraceae bacterium]|nr:ATP-binding protein [Lachnospiraceae bacterium]